MTRTATEIHKGLAGVVVDRTAISEVVPETNSLTYRGYAVQELAATRSFEEVAFLQSGTASCRTPPSWRSSRRRSARSGS